VNGLRVVEIGCGGGAFSLELLRAGATHATGIDVSPDVVAVANRKARDQGLADRATFIATTIEDAVTKSFGHAELLVGLGILEYLEPAVVVQLLRAVRPDHVVFSFDERRATIKTALHFVYRQLKQFPHYKKYSASELTAVLASAGVPHTSVFRDGDNSFITTFV
jgi:2-polyprenyl-3-methyl-5-hydroxy-6-metoxy-1,4-benzoquinol methylase